MEEDWDSLVGALPPAQGGAVSQAAGAKDKHSVAEDEERSVCPIAAVIESTSPRFCG